MATKLDQLIAELTGGIEQLTRTTLRAHGCVLYRGPHDADEEAAGREFVQGWTPNEDGLVPLAAVEQAFRAGCDWARERGPEGTAHGIRHLTDEQWRVLLWSLARSTCLSDHVGDVWRGFHTAWEILGLAPFEEDPDGPDFDFIERQGGRNLYDLRKEWGTPDPGETPAP